MKQTSLAAVFASKTLPTTTTTTNNNINNKTTRKNREERMDSSNEADLVVDESALVSLPPIQTSPDPRLNRQRIYAVTESDLSKMLERSRMTALRFGRSDLAAAVPGLTYAKFMLSIPEEAELLAIVNAQPWRNDLRRRTQHYGWLYRYQERRVAESDFLGPLPDWLVTVADRLHKLHLLPHRMKFDQVIVNEYLPGQGIAAHVDQPSMFQDTVVMVSLGSGTTMEFTPVRGGPSRSLRLERRSAACITGEARYKWTHAIPPRKSDPSPSGRIKRERRVSLTFRTVTQSVAGCSK